MGERERELYTSRNDRDISGKGATRNIMIIRRNGEMQGKSETGGGERER